MKDTRSIDEDISITEKALNWKFPQDYIDFIKSGYNLGESILEALEVGDTESYLDIVQVTNEARESYDLPTNLQPIVEDNSDYYCLTTSNEVVFWSHNGITDEKWDSLSSWIQAMEEEA